MTVLRGLTRVLQIKLLSIQKNQKKLKSSLIIIPPPKKKKNSLICISIVFFSEGKGNLTIVSWPLTFVQNWSKIQKAEKVKTGKVILLCLLQTRLCMCVLYKQEKKVKWYYYCCCYFLLRLKVQIHCSKMWVIYVYIFLNFFLGG